MRSASAPALLAHGLHGRRARDPVSRAIGSDTGVRLLTAAAVGEVIADKTPWVPDRIAAPALIGRAVSGAVAGWIIGRSGRRDGFLEAAAGAVTAIAAAHGAFRLRRSVGTRSAVPDALLGIAEDMLVYGVGSRLLQGLPGGRAVR